MNIVDNFLLEEDFNKIKETIFHTSFPWLRTDNVANANDLTDTYFVHPFYGKNAIHSNYFSVLNPLLEKLEVKALVRARCLVYLRKEKLIEHDTHTDFSFPHKTCVYYINDNDGFTRLADDTCVYSVKNRALLFDGSQKHNSTNCTNQKCRFVLTINYF